MAELVNISVGADCEDCDGIHVEGLGPAGDTRPFVLFLHGLGAHGSRASLVPLIESLAGVGVSLIRMDFEGHGRSLRGARGVLSCVESVVGSVVRVLDMIIGRPGGLSRDFWVCGHSVGGLIALLVEKECDMRWGAWLLKDLPHERLPLFRGLILLSPFVECNGATVWQEMVLGAVRVGARMPWVRDMPLPLVGLREMNGARIWVSAEYREYVEQRDDLATNRTSVSVQTAGTVLDAIRRLAARPWLLQCRVTLIWDRVDHPTLDRICRAKCARMFEGYDMDGALHDPLANKPADVCQVIVARVSCSREDDVGFQEAY